MTFVQKRKTMAKDQAFKLAQYYYVEKCKTAKEVAVLVGVTAATMSKWIAKGGWKARRDAQVTSATSRCDNLQQVISELAEQRISLRRDLDEAINRKDLESANDIRKQMASIDDGVAKWNKSLENAKKIAQVTLPTYLDVMEQIFNSLRNFDEKLYLQTINFQEHHVEEVSRRS